MQKISFECEDCNAAVTVRLGDDYDEYRVAFCPCCGAPAPTNDDDED
jgi:Zn finger protein HypA/HybF involved in hydrogenase expression